MSEIAAASNGNKTSNGNETGTDQGEMVEKEPSEEKLKDLPGEKRHVASTEGQMDEISPVEEGGEREEDGLFQPPIVKKLGEPVILIRDLTKSYALKDAGRGDGEESNVVALRGVHLHDDPSANGFYSIRRGEFVMIRGASGGGKTTLLNCIGLLDKPSKGVVNVLGSTVDFERTSDKEMSYIRLKRLGFVFQTFNLLSTFSSIENVELPMTILAKLSKSERRERARRLLTMVGLEDRLDHLPSELSGGEQQRVTIARALANDPEILLLDEPTGDLDTLNTLEIMKLLLDVNRNGKKTMLMVTHNPDLECYADRILYVRDGRFCRQVLNRRQAALDLENYLAYIKRRDETTG